MKNKIATVVPKRAVPSQVLQGSKSLGRHVKQDRNMGAYIMALEPINCWKNMTEQPIASRRKRDLFVKREREVLLSFS